MEIALALGVGVAMGLLTGGVLVFLAAAVSALATHLIANSAAKTAADAANAPKHIRVYHHAADDDDDGDDDFFFEEGEPPELPHGRALDLRPDYEHLMGTEGRRN